mgnify:CR=1 FL=1
METEPGQKKHLFTNKQLWALLVPVVVEQILIYASLILTVISLITYLWQNRSVLSMQE